MKVVDFILFTTEGFHSARFVKSVPIPFWSFVPTISTTSFGGPPRRLLLLSILSVNQDIQDPTVVLSVTSPTRSLDVLVVLPSPLRNRPVFISVWPSIHGLKTPNIDKELLQ